MAVKSKKNKKKTNEVQKQFLSSRQKRIFLIIVAVMIIAVPIIDNLRCKSACMKRVKTPYPEIACRYECPWPWQKND